MVRFPIGCVALALLSLRAVCTPIVTGQGSASLQNKNIRFREQRQTIAKGHQRLKSHRFLKGVVEHVKTKHHPNLSTLKKLLRDVSAALTQHGVVHHITGGTLVGWKRNKQIIPVSEHFCG